MEKKDLLVSDQYVHDREIILTRIIKAPRELVFEAFTNPEHVVRWYGPTGFTTTNHEMDVRPGGKWRYTMHGPDGVDYPNRVVYSEVIKPEKLVYLHGWDVDDDPRRFEVTVTFEDLGGKTRLTMRSIFPSVEEFNKVVNQYGAIEGGKQTLDRLEALMAETSTSSNSPVKILELTRILDASPAKVFKAWTDPEQLARWWGPKDYTSPVCKLDLRPGGSIYIDMKAPDGTVYPMKGKFLEITAPSKLVFSSLAFEDESGVVHLEILNTVTFEEFQGKTRLSLIAEVLKASPLVGSAMEGVSSMDHGWNQSLDRLASLVK